MIMKVMTSRLFFGLLVVGWLALSAALLVSDTVRYLIVLPHDWAAFTEVPERLANGSLYDLGQGYYWAWAPAAAWLMAYAIVPLGYPFWIGLHLAAVPLLRHWQLIALTVVSVPFWIDVIIGNSVAFVFVTGILAIRGSRSGALVYLALCLLMPRPVQAPLAVWILWRRADARVPFAVIAVLTIATAVWSGYAEEWIAVLVPLAGSNYNNPANFGPTNLFGAAWFLVGFPLAVWLTVRGRTGLAGLAMTPYLLPQYFLLLLWELPFPRKNTVAPSPTARLFDPDRIPSASPKAGTK